MTVSHPAAGSRRPGTPPDPGSVRTCEQLGRALMALAGGRGQSAIAAEARKLSPPESLTKQTVNDLYHKGRPSEATLAAFLRVCGVPRDQHAAWQAARERAVGRPGRTSALHRLVDLVRIDATDPRALGVHAAIDVPGAAGTLPTYVERDADTGPAGLRARIQRAAADATGQFLLLVGEASAGKTRCAYEAIRHLLPHGWLLLPTDVEQLRHAAAHPFAGLVVWLDELQQHLRGSGGLTPHLVRTLTRSGVLLVATLREDSYQQYAREIGPGDSRAYASAWEVVRKHASVLTIPARLSAAEQARARAAAAHDRHLAAGLRID
ncbi:hypothetical protein AB0J43_56925, partial [Nonomuraea fuscirosea]